MADSVCGQLHRFQHHHFIVVLSSFLGTTKAKIKDCKNVEVLDYTIPNTFQSIVLGRDKFLDGLVADNKVDAVLTIFGPSRWRPRVPHLSGFALPQMVIPKSPYFQRMNRKDRQKWNLWCMIRKWSLKRSADCFWTENPYISDRLEKLMGGANYELKVDFDAAVEERRLAA